jgi:phage/plasmid-associated DNA primase
VMREDMFAGVEPEETERRILRIRQQMGLAMLGAQKLSGLHSVLVMLGQGFDGKSTLLELLQDCMPPNSWLAMQPQDLASGTGDGAEGRADLHNLFAVMCDDVSERSMGDSSRYKTATACGTVRGRHFGSGVKSFNVNVRATWLLAGQQLWHTTDKTRGFQRRHSIIEFPNSIPDGEADRALRDKLLAHEQREIVLWCVQAAIGLLKGGNLAQPECSARLMRGWMLGDNDVASFLEANTEDCSSEPKESWPRTEDVHREYDQWVRWAAGSGKANPANLIHFGRKARQVKGVQVEPHRRVSRISRRVTKGEG